MKCSNGMKRERSQNKDEYKLVVLHVTWLFRRNDARTSHAHAFSQTAICNFLSALRVIYKSTTARRKLCQYKLLARQTFYVFMSIL